MLQTLNKAEIHEGLSDDRYTVEKSFANRRVYIYYYLTLPLQGQPEEMYAVVDFVGLTKEEEAK